MAALAEGPNLIQTTERVSPPMLADELASLNPPLVIDVRTPTEWAAGHIEGSINLPLTQLQQHIDKVPHNRRIAVHCAGGYRSSIAASVLRQHGITNLIELAGGIAAWEAAKLKTITG
jgi:rhodanese-related sulfurtransferase